MKIFVLNIDPKFRPDRQVFRYPSHNEDYGIEQDIFEYLKKSDHLINDSSAADWHYLPVYWTRWHLEHDYGKTGLDELKAAVDAAIIDSSKTFAVCQYDDGPIVDIGKTRTYLGSRQTQEHLDAPLLSSDHKLPLFKPAKKYLASFAGRLSTHSIRQELFELLKNDNRFYFSDGSNGEKLFVKTMLQSSVALCPRGYGGGSFRFYEAMQMGVVPFQIGDVDTRPFKSTINWNEFSFYTNDVSAVKKILESKSAEQLKEMGQKARAFYKSDLSFGKWCKHLIKDLENERK